VKRDWQLKVRKGPDEGEVVESVANGVGDGYRDRDRACEKVKYDKRRVDTMHVERPVVGVILGLCFVRRVEYCP
jgi:hypothetical protein